MKNPKKDPKRIKRFQERARMITMANMAYRGVLKAIVGWSNFQNIDARATMDESSLHDAAMKWPEEVWND